MPTIEFSNNAISHATDKLLTILSRVAKLENGHPDHLKLAVKIGDLIQHPLKDKVRSITVARPRPTKVSKPSTGFAIGVVESAQTLAFTKTGVKPRPKPTLKKMKVNAFQEQKGDDTGPGHTCKDSLLAYSSSQKGRPTQIQKRQKASTTGSPPIASGTLQPDVTAMITIQTNKDFKKAQSHSRVDVTGA
ncbi:hypothetical protein BDR07DRAFT_1374205 [Suillus spraguei]|nr:hypothetical protein BDR07DRAFT_1374205 [Suillus spraguei]